MRSLKTQKLSPRSGFFGGGIIRSKKKQFGLTVVEVSLALILSAVVAAATIQAKVKEQQVNSGIAQADALKQLKIAVDLYSAENRARIGNPAITEGIITRPNGTTVVVPNKNAPTVQHLIDGELLRVGFPQTSFINDGAYIIRVDAAPVGCTPNTCGVEGVAYIDQPILAPGGAAGEYDGVVVSAILGRIGGDGYASVVNGNELVTANGANALVNPNGNRLGTVGVRVGIPRLGSAQFDNIDVFGNTVLNNLTTTGTVVFDDGVDAAGNPVENTMTVNSDTTFNDSLTVSPGAPATFGGPTRFDDLVTFNGNTQFNGNSNTFRNIRVTEELISEGNFESRGTTTTRTITVNDAGGNPCIRLLDNGQINILCDGILEAESGTFALNAPGGTPGDRGVFQIGEAIDPLTGNPTYGVRMLEPNGQLRAELFSSLNPNAISVRGGQVLFRDPANGAILAGIDGIGGRQGNLIARQGLGARTLHLRRRVDGAGLNFVAGDTCPADMNANISLTAPFDGEYGSFIVNNFGTMLVCQNDGVARRLVAVGNEMVGFNDGCVVDGQIATLRESITLPTGEIFRQGEGMMCRTGGSAIGSYQPMKNVLSRLVEAQSLIVRHNEVVSKPVCASVGGGARGVPVGYVLAQSEASADGVFERRLEDVNSTQWRVIMRDGAGNALDGGVGAGILVRYCLY